MERDEGPCIVPARNLMLISLAANLAIGNCPTEVWIGATPSDETDYNDCRPHFLIALNHVMKSTYGVMVRYARETREERIQSLGEAAELCWSCYRDQPEPCGECASCRQ
jgi:7-cyano-7-deazaguanine synthase in queuosine biosynthesis